MGFAIGGGGWNRSRDRSVDNDGVVLLLIRATGDRLIGGLRHVGLDQIWGK